MSKVNLQVLNRLIEYSEVVCGEPYSDLVSMRGIKIRGPTRSQTYSRIDEITRKVGG